MNQAQQLASKLLAMNGHGVGAALDVQRMQPGVGAALDVQRMQPGVGNPAMQGAIAANAINYNAAAYDRGGLTWLGFGSTAIAAGGINIPVQINTVRPFTPQLVYNPSTNIGLLINAVNLEGTNMFANTLGIPIELWSEVSNAPQIQWPTLDTSTGIQFLLSNPTGAPINFQGGFWGTQVRR